MALSSQKIAVAFAPVAPAAESKDEKLGVKAGEIIPPEVRRQQFRNRLEAKLRLDAQAANILNKLLDHLDGETVVFSKAEVLNISDELLDLLQKNREFLPANFFQIGLETPQTALDVKHIPDGKSHDSSGKQLPVASKFRRPVIWEKQPKKPFENYAPPQQVKKSDLCRDGSLITWEEYKQVRDDLKNKPPGIYSVPGLRHLFIKDEYAEIFAIHEDVIGKGTFGAVQRIQNIKTKEWRAVKIRWCQSSDQELSCESELGKLRALGKSNQTKLIYRADRKAVCLIMKLERGVDLWASRHQRQYLHSSHLLLKAVRAFDAYYFGVFLYGYLHRDIKEENFLDDSSLTEPVDFGYAEKYNPSNTEYKDNSNRGTAGYRAPEVVCHYLYSEKSEVFAWGCLLSSILMNKCDDQERKSGTFWRGRRTSFADNPSVVNFIKLTLDNDPSKRPSLKQVYTFLHRLKVVYDLREMTLDPSRSDAIKAALIRLTHKLYYSQSVDFSEGDFNVCLQDAEVGNVLREEEACLPEDFVCKLAELKEKFKAELKARAAQLSLSDPVFIMLNKLLDMLNGQEVDFTQQEFNICNMNFFIADALRKNIIFLPQFFRDALKNDMKELTQELVKKLNSICEALQLEFDDPIFVALNKLVRKLHRQDIDFDEQDFNVYCREIIVVDILQKNKGLLPKDFLIKLQEYMAPQHARELAARDELQILFNALPKTPWYSFSSPSAFPMDHHRVPERSVIYRLMCFLDKKNIPFVANFSLNENDMKIINGNRKLKDFIAKYKDVFADCMVTPRDEQSVSPSKKHR